MGCNNPILMKDKDGKIYEVPCRKCLGCRKTAIRQWSYRILWEIKTYYEEYGLLSSFVTLTYRDEDLPIDMSLKDYDIKCFIKRLRKNTKNEIKIARASEYGDLGGRPHYHMILIGVDPKRDREIKEIWGKGEIDCKIAQFKNIRYCIKYIMKQQTTKELEEIYDNAGLERPKVVFSKGMGEKYMLKHLDEIRKYGGIHDGEKLIGIPLYYKHKFGVIDHDFKYSKERKIMNNNRIATAKKWGYENLWEYEENQRRIDEITLRSKAQKNGEKAVWNVFENNLKRPLKND